jgi:hypothetical protein
MDVFGVKMVTKRSVCGSHAIPKIISQDKEDLAQVCLQYLYLPCKI